jgi:hypothetical protein
MPSTYDKIEAKTLGSASTSVTFSTIPATYTDLVLVLAGTIGSGNIDVAVQVNGDTGSNYSRTFLFGDGSSAASGRSSSASSWVPAGLSTTQGNMILQFMNYSNTTTNKTFIGRSSIPSVYAVATVGLWRNTAAINSITLSNTNNFSTGSTFTLYGIKAA